MARMGERKLCTVGKPKGNRTLESFRRRRKDIIKINPKEIGRKCVDWIDVAQDRNNGRPLMEKAVIFRVS